MANPYKRTDRVADLMQRELAEILRTRVNDPRFKNITITAIDVSPDMQNAAIYISVLNNHEAKDILLALNKAAGFFRSQLADVLNLRFTPKVRFVYDESIEQGNRINALIEAAFKNKNDDFSNENQD